MKKIISKILVIFIVIIMLLEFSFSSNVSYAFDSKDINAITNLVGGLVSFLFWFKRIQITAISWIMGTVLTQGLAESCGLNYSGSGACATPFDIFFNTYKIFDVDFFDLSSGNSSLLISIRTKVAEWFYILRTISAAILLGILIYVGIRMAISTIAEDKAKYKKMFWDWCCSLALIFLLQYIAIITIETNNVIVNFLRNTLENNGKSDIGKIMDNVMWEAMAPMGIGAIVSTIVYCMITFQTVAFMLIYIKRMIKVGFLIIISPMISITYSIDKMGDGKAQALNKWLKEFVYTILIQPFHCIMYLTFVNTAIGLLDSGISISGIVNDSLWSSFGNMNHLANGFLAILCLKFMTDGEKAIRKIFNFQDDDKMTSLAAGAVMGMAAINGAKKIGNATSKGVNTAKNISTKFKKAKANDAKSGAFGKLKGQLGKAKESFKNTTNALKDTKIGGALSKAGSKIGDSKLGQLGKSAIEKGKFAGGKITNAGKFVGGKAKADKLKGKVNDYKFKFEQKHPGLAKKIKSAKTLGVNKFKSSLPVALGLMGAAMSYSTGSSGVMQAIGVGSAMSRGTEGFLASSQGTLEGNIQENLNEDVQDNENVQNAQKELYDSAEKITEANENLKETNTAIENMSEAEQANGNDYTDLLKEEDELGAKQSELQGKPNLSPEEKKELAAIQKRQAEIADKKQKLKDDPEIAKVLPTFEKKHNLEKQLSQEKSKRGELEAKAKEIRKKAAEDMIKKYENNGSSAQIARAKAEILKKLQMCMMESKYKDSQGDVSMDYSLSDKETRSAERMQESICSLIDRAVVAGGGRLDSGQVLKRYFGEDTNSLMAQKLKQSIDTYQFQARAKNYNDNEELYKNSGGTKEKFRKDVSTKASNHG